MNIRQHLTKAKLILASTSETALLDAELLLAHILNVTRAYLYTYPEKDLDEAIEKQFWELIAQRRQGKPIAYLMGGKEFWSLQLAVNSNTLIPRPETELLVSAALSKFAGEKTIEVADLGTGSGAVALALASEKPEWKIWAADASTEALKIAEQNRQALQLNNVQVILSDWYEALPNSLFDLIISNPPYIAENDPHLVEGDVRFEPKFALIAGDEGLAALQIIIEQGVKHLKPKGWLIVEHGYQQAPAVQAMMAKSGFFNIATQCDLMGNSRVTMGQL